MLGDECILPVERPSVRRLRSTAFGKMPSIVRLVVDTLRCCFDGVDFLHDERRSLAISMRRGSVDDVHVICPTSRV